MFVIGERINGMFDDVARAIRQSDKAAIQDLALKQIEAGADALDVNVGPAAEHPLGAMEWLVKTIGEVTDVPLAIDTPKFEVMEAGLKLCKSKAIINSTSGDREKLERLLPLVKEYNASIIGLTMNKSGIPKNTESRAEIAAQIVTRAQEQGIEMSELYIDAVILPVNVAQDHSKEVLETIRQCKLLCDPPPQTILGLSNVSQKTLNRALVNRTYLVMAIASGLDAAILDPLDKDLMNSMITAELLMGKQIYCDNYLEAYKKK
jgi:5-methyltetrahydrofolate corrinoid/iron sulfur protein methyltransferase